MYSWNNLGTQKWSVLTGLSSSFFLLWLLAAHWCRRLRNQYPAIGTDDYRVLFTELFYSCWPIIATFYCIGSRRWTSRAVLFKSFWALNFGFSLSGLVFSNQFMRELGLNLYTCPNQRRCCYWIVSLIVGWLRQFDRIILLVRSRRETLMILLRLRI